MMILEPGAYLIELESSRPIEARTLARVMASLGFSRVVPDQMPESTNRVRTGALPGRSAATAARSFVVAPATSVNRLAYASPTPAPPPAPKPVTTATTSVVQLAKAPSTVSTTVRKPSAMIDPNTKPAEMLPRYAQPQKKVVARTNVLARAPVAPKKKEPGMFDWGPGGAPPPPSGPAGPSAPSEPAPETSPEMPGGTPGESYGEPDAVDYGPIPLGPGPGEGGGGGGGFRAPSGEGASYPGGEGGDAYQASAPTAGPLSAASQMIRVLWQTWRDTGNPFSPSTSGVEMRALDRPCYVVRMLVELTRKLEAANTDTVRWISAVPVGFNVFGDMNFNLFPFQLRSGQDYELRFVSRARSAPNRNAVLDLMRSMGWEPKRLSAIKKDMRLPGRAGANLTLWYAVARWVKPQSRIVADDPFYFEDVREVG